MKLWQVKGWAWLIPWACQPTGYPRGAVHRDDVAMGAGWHGHPHLILPFLLGSWLLPCWGPPGARRKMKESYLSHEIYLNLTLAFFQTGTFGGQFYSKLCCLCSSTCWLAMKHQAAKQSRHTACQAAFQGNAWAAWPQSHARVLSSCIPEQDSVHTPIEGRDLPLWVVGVWYTGSTAFSEAKEMVCKKAEEMDSDGKFPFPSKCQWTSTTSCAYKIFCLLETNPRSYRQSRLLRETEGCLLRLIRMGNGWAAGWTGKNKLPDILPSAIQTPSPFLFSPLGFAKPKGFRCLTFRT